MACRASRALRITAAAVTRLAGFEVIETRVTVATAKATMRSGDLPAMSVRVSVRYGKDLLRRRRQAALQLKKEAAELAMVTVSKGAEWR